MIRLGGLQMNVIIFTLHIQYIPQYFWNLLAA